MGKWAEYSWDKELMEKIHQLWNETITKIQKDNPESQLSFEDFVTCLDPSDRMTKKLFEVLVKETMATNLMASARTRGTNSNDTQSASPSHQPISRTYLLLPSSLGPSGNSSSASFTLVPASFLSPPSPSPWNLWSASAYGGDGWTNIVELGVLVRCNNKTTHTMLHPPYQLDTRI